MTAVLPNRNRLEVWGGSQSWLNKFLYYQASQKDFPNGTDSI